MSTETIAANLRELRLAGAANGVSCTTTATKTPLPLGTKFVSMTGRNYSTAVVIRVNLNPWLTVLKTTDLLATKANLTDYSEAAQDGSTSTDVVLSSLDTLANLGAVYIGSHVPFAGLTVDVDSANGTAATLAVTYWDGSAWSNITPTDGTASGGATFAQDGDITWTIPAAWVTGKLETAVATAAKRIGLFQQELYWVRLAVSAALDSSTTLNSILAINRSTAYAELVSGVPWEQAVNVGPGGVSSVTSLTDAGTANLLINVATPGRFQ